MPPPQPHRSAPLTPDTRTPPKTKPQEGLEEKGKIVRGGGIKNDMTCGYSKLSNSQLRVCKYVRGRATESLLMTHTEEFHTKPYRTDVSYMSSLGPGKEVETRLESPQNHGLFNAILTALPFSPTPSPKKKQKKTQKHRLSWRVGHYSH